MNHLFKPIMKSWQYFNFLVLFNLYNPKEKIQNEAIKINNKKHLFLNHY